VRYADYSQWLVPACVWQIPRSDEPSALDMATQILNNQLNSLQWLDSKVVELSAKMQSLTAESRLASMEPLRGNLSGYSAYRNP